MKKILLTLLLLPLATYSQVGIGTTTPDNSSMLEVDATDKGVLVPRVAIANLNTAAPVTAPVESLLVYNTTIATGVGFHYWDGAKWTPLSGAAANDGDWTVVGNDMYNANSGYVGVGTTTPTAKLHIESAVAGATAVYSNDFESGVVTSVTGPFNSCTPTNIWNISSTTSYCSNCSGDRAYINYEACDMDQTLVEGPFSTTETLISISFNYGYENYTGDVEDRFVVTLESISPASVVTLLDLTSDDLNASYSGIHTVTSGVNYSLHFKYTGNDDYGAAVDDIVVTATAPPTIRIVDGNEQAGRLLTSDALGNASWQDAGEDNDWTTSGTDIYNTNTGNVGVGTTTPIEKLHVSAQHMLLEFDPDAVYSTKNTGTGKGYELIGSYQGWDNNAIYIGGYNANHTGNDYDDADKVICGGNTSGFVGVGTLAITATAFNISSSERFKKNISTLEYGLEDLLKIKPVKYQYNFEKSGLYTIGFIAEEVSEVIPEVVSHQNENHKVVSREEGKPVSMDYSKMSAVLVNAVKEQYSKVQELKKNNETLKARLARIEEVLLESAKK
jgi:hypothetical protein